MSSIRKPTATSKSSAYGGRLKSSRNGGLSFEVDQMYTTMQKGHSVYKIALLKKWDRDQKFLSLNMDTRQICLTKPGAAPMTLDLRYVKEAHTLDFKLHTVSITDKWTKDKELRTANAIHVLLIAHGHGFNLSYWILYFNDKGEAAAVWAQGINHIVAETIAAPHPMVINRWMRKQYNALALMPNSEISIKHMKPFTQTTLQCKVQTKFLQELMKPNMNFADFETATRAMITNNSPIFLNFFAELCEDGQNVTFPNFRRFLRDFQFDEMHTSRERTNEFLRKYLAGPSQPKHSHGIDQSLSVNQFNDLLFARENSLWDPMNEKVVHDMSRPLSHYWIASSHNTYLTGDQLRSESSLDSYARALMMGCRCIELDCWDGTRKNNSQEVVDIVIYHGYTMTSKLQLRDVLFTIKHYAFMNSDFPVILSIEDNCSVQAQRILAHDIKEILGDLLLTQPVSREETQLPSPLSMKRKIIIKHKKLALESEDLTISPNDDFQDTDLMDKECVKRGMMMMRNPTTNEWTSHIFILFHDRLCYTIETYNENESKQQEDSVSVMGDDEQPPEEQMSGFGVRPEEMHVTEEWFHGKCDRQTAVVRLMEHTDKGNGLFLVRDSTIFIGDFSLSFLHEGKVYHCRIKTKMKEGEKKYYFLEGVEMDTLFELICHYMKVALTTPNFSTNLILPCPQPQPHLTEPWFSPTATQKTAEEMLAKVPEDGAFLVRYSSGDQSVFVLSVRLDGVTCHFRLKRNGRIFVVNQTVFETLNQIVEYYSSRDFIRGTSLKFPVNEKSIEMYANSVGEAAPGCYLDIATFDQNIQARALRPYQGEKVEQLSFPANAIITVLKKDGQLWRGKYEGKVGWFPPSFVQEISPQDKKGEKDAYATIELAGALVERMTSSESHDRPNVLRITHASQHWTGQQWLVAAATIEDADDWSNNLTEILRTANEKISNLRTKEKTARIASELSNLVVYCQAVPFNPARIRDGSFYEMCSFSESKLEKILEKGLVQFNSRQLSRVYPQGTRVTSTNFSPIPMWNAGCHMVALNYQTGDKAMQVNNGKFLTNGRCGYVLKPQYMLDDAFDPQQGSKVSTSVPIQLSVKVIAGRHLSRKDKNKGICSPFVEIEILGLQCDERSVKTNTITSNGLNPYWNEQFVFQIHCPEIALLRFVAEDGDFVGPKTDPFIGQAVFPIDSIRSGYRSVTLKNQYSEELELSSLLVHVEITPLVDKGPTNMSPHALLQASRSVYATARSASTTSAPYSPPPFQKTPSLDQKVGPSRMTSLDVPPAAEAPAAPRERNLSVDEKKKNGKPLFKKILSFGRKDSH